MITKEQFKAYEAVRRSGVTNMFNVGLITELSGLSREQCIEIMRNHDKLKTEFMPDIKQVKQ